MLTPLPGVTANRLEAALYDLQFRDVPVGSLLGQVWHAVLCGTSESAGVRARVRSLAGKIWRAAPQLGQDARAALEPGRLLSTWINPEPHCRDLVLPLVEQVGAENWHVMGRSEEMRRSLPVGCGYLSWSNLPRVPPSTWWPEYLRLRPTIRERAESILASVPEYIGLWPRIEPLLPRQLDQVVSYHRLLKRLRPRLVVTEWDRHPRICPLVGTARAQGVPTLTQVHGVLNTEFGYTPLLADAALCWGQQQRDQFIAMGVSPERLLVTGYPRLNREQRMDGGEIRQNAGFDSAKPLVLLASNKINAELRLNLAEQFCLAMTGCEGLQAAVRLHPAEDLALYQQLRRRFPSIRFMDKGVWALDEALAAATVVVCHASGLGNDALVKGRQVIVFDVLPLPLGNGQVLIDQAGCPRAGTLEELRLLVEQVINKRDASTLLWGRAERYVDYFCAAFGAEATRNAANVVLERALPHH